ncbi:MAG: FAD-containing monooxygenase EthA, partial [Actinomycetota bacterium]
LGDVQFRIDDEPLAFHDTVTYRGIMFTGVPNLAYVFGYFRASWTLRADLIADLVCRLVNHMEERGSTMVVPTLRDTDLGMELGPWVDPENFNPGYLMRSMHRMPRQGPHDPWRLLHEYAVEREVLPAADFEDGTLTFK